jgi:site-specific recombinase XerD
MIETFANYLAINRGLSQHTVKAYKEALHDFASYVNDNHPGTTWRKVTKQMIDSYVVDLVAEDMAPASIKQHISALRTFFKTCQALGQQIENPARYVSTPKLKDELPKTIEMDAIKKALASQLVHPQAKAAIAIILETGIRLQELLDLKPSDIDNRTSSIRIHGKGNKERTVYYGELTRQYGRCWRGSEHTQRWVRHQIYNALRPYTDAKQLSPHALRHTFASAMLNNGATMESLRKLLGHEHLETTEIYAKLSNSKTREQYLQFMPRL